MPTPPITKAHPWTPSRGRFTGRTSTEEYRNALAREKGFASWHDQQRAAVKVTPTSHAALRPPAKQGRAAALDALAKMRHGASFTRAAKEAGTTPNTVVRYVGDELHRESGRVVATTSDRLFRWLPVTTTEGVQRVERAARGRRRLSASTPTPSKRSFRPGRCLGSDCSAQPAQVRGRDGRRQAARNTAGRTRRT